MAQQQRPRRLAAQPSRLLGLLLLATLGLLTSGLRTGDAQPIDVRPCTMHITAVRS